jgi:hypothetical protein
MFFETVLASLACTLLIQMSLTNRTFLPPGLAASMYQPAKMATTNVTSKSKKRPSLSEKRRQERLQRILHAGPTTTR